MAEVYRKQIIELLNEIDDSDIRFFKQMRIMIRTHLWGSVPVGKEVSGNGTETWNG